GLLHELDLGPADRAHPEAEAPAGAKIELVDGGEEALRAPPRLEAFLRRPELPDVRERRAVAPAEGLGCTQRAVAHEGLSFPSFWARARCLRSSAAPRRSRRDSHSSR